MDVKEYRAELKKALQAMTDETTGELTWTEKDVEEIMKGQNNNVIKQVMQFNTPEEYTEILSM